MTQWFAPEPSVQPVRIARSLRDAGHDVQVLTGVPNYPTGRVHVGYRASRTAQETYEGMSVRRTPLYPSHDSNALGRMFNYLSWAVSSTLLGGKALRDREVTLVYSSPATAAMTAMAARRLYGVPYVLLIQDVWPDSVFSSGFLGGRSGRFLERILNIFVDRTYAKAARVAVISPGMKDLLVSRGVDPEKIVLVYNAVEEDPSAIDVAQVELARSELGIEDDDVVFMYAGNHGAAQGLKALVDAVGMLPGDSRVKLVMVGDGMEKAVLQSAVGASGSNRIIFLPPVPRSEMPVLMRLSDIQVVALADRPLFSVTMPSKVQSILAAGRPLLVIAQGDVADVVQDSGSGAVARPGDPQGIAVALESLAAESSDHLAAMGAAGREYYEIEMSPERNMERLLEALEVSARETPEASESRTSTR